MLNKTPILTCVLLSSIFLVSCASKTTQPEEAAVVEAVEEEVAVDSEHLALLNQRIVFFAFDSAELSDETREVLDAHAKNLLTNGGTSIRLDGHCDERGTREYNLALGAARANSVARYLQTLGVTSDRVTTVTYGEERPLALGDNEQAWARNRRTEIHYLQ